MCMFLSEKLGYKRDLNNSFVKTENKITFKVIFSERETLLSFAIFDPFFRDEFVLSHNKNLNSKDYYFALKAFKDKYQDKISEKAKDRIIQELQSIFGI